ncbi:hypothetical protein ACH4UT_29095 [Streptomyces sp. NPDC020799]|uniref:hypothetical protein n=1 Tax=Streptomyces sp. NPDC020799 TaxID=3365091 RepID=UPI00379AAB98
MPDPTTLRDLESFAQVLAGELPGRWTSHYHRHAEYADQFPVAEDVWDMNLVSGAIAEYVLGHDAVLTRDDGARLYVTGRPRHPDEYLVGAIAPTGFEPEAFRGVHEPDGIPVPHDPFRAAKDIASDLLPRYKKAVAQVQHNAAHPSPPVPAPAREPERVVMTWFGDGMLAAKADSPQAAKALHDNGFAYDPREQAFVLAGDDTALQAQAVRAAGTQLAAHGIGVILRHPPSRPALETTTTPPAQPAKPSTRTR